LDEEYPREVQLSLFDHLKELRSRLFWCVGVIVVFFIMGFIFGDPIYKFLTAGIPDDIRQRSGSLTEPIMLKIKIAIYSGCFFALPFITWHIYGFLRPALKVKDDSFARTFIISFFGLLLLAFFFTYNFIPHLIRNLQAFAPEGVELEADVLEYISTILTVYLGFSIIFQVPLIIFLTIIQGVVELKTYTENRKWVVVILLVLCAIFSPPDLISQIIIFIPLYGLFEISLLASRLLKR
jgi:sec-independent protein translocase protein TatC